MKESYLKRYPLSHFVIAVVIILSLAPIPEMPRLPDINLLDKWAHFVMYGGLCLVIVGSLRHVRRFMPCHLVGILATASPNQLATCHNWCYPVAYHTGNTDGTGTNLPYHLPHGRLARCCCQCHRSCPWSSDWLLYFAQDL